MIHNSPQSSEWLEIGTIVAPQGLHGQLRVHSNSDFPERFVEAGTRWLRYQGNADPQEIELLDGRLVPGKKLYVVSLAGVETRDEAEALRGAVLLVPESHRLPLEEDEYHVMDIIGLAVFHQQTGDRLGTVVDILSAGHDLLQVQLDAAVNSDRSIDGGDGEVVEAPKKMHRKKPKRRPKVSRTDTVLIPFVQEIVPVVDLQNQRIEIAPPPGLIDLRFGN